MADQGPLSGKLLGGRYLLHERLGSGGFADVYRAEHRHLKTIHAVKVLTRQLHAAEIEQFRAEAQTIAALAHPHILRVSDFDLDNGVPFLVMDYAPGGTLRQQHPSGRSVPLTTVVQYVRQVAEALQHAHDQRRIHRDIKPQNLLLGSQGEVLLSDFGIAVIAQSTSQLRTEGYSGTAAYSAPEQILGKPRPASDQYALGVMVYEWLTGRLPFQGGMVEMIGQHLNAPVSPLRASVPDLPPAAEQVVLKALAKDPKDRYPSVRAFAQALEAAYKIAQHPPLGTLLRTYAGHTGPVGAVAWSPDSKLLASAGEDGTAQIWEATSGQHLVTCRHQVNNISFPVYSVVWAPDGMRLASVCQGTYDGRDPKYRSHLGYDTNRAVLVWDTSSGQRLLPSQHRCSWVSWSPDGHYLGLAGEDTLHILDTNTTDKILIIPRREYPDTFLDHWWQSPIWLPDGQHIAAISLRTRGKSMKLDDGTFKKRLAELMAQVRVEEHSLQKSGPDWGTEVCTYSGHTAPVRVAIWSPDGRRLASSSSDKTIQVWDAQTAQHFCTYQGHAEQVQATAWSPVSAIAWSPDGKRIASSVGEWCAPKDAVVHIWDAANGQHLYTYTGHAQSVNAVAWSPDGTRIASASDDGTVQVWSAG